MIAGRSANLFLGAATAAVALVWGIAAQVGTPLSPELAALVVAFLGAREADGPGPVGEANDRADFSFDRITEVAVMGGAPDPS
jgi:hypothetical protein